jgi:hypothetical protein
MQVVTSLIGFDNIIDKRDLRLQNEKKKMKR